MAVRSYALALSGTAKRLSDAYGVGAAGVADAASDIPYRQLLLTVSGAAATLGSSAASAATGTPLATGAVPTTIGPFETGPVKLSDFWAVGTGATLQVLGVPF
jgi:di/tricarboxylate transporter